MQKTSKGFAEALREESEIYVKRILQLYALMSEQEKEEARLTGYVSEEAVKSYKQFDDFPNALKAKHIMAMYGVSLAKAYQLLNHHGCPKNPRLGKNCTPKMEFIAWMESESGTHGELLKGGAYE